MIAWLALDVPLDAESLLWLGVRVVSANRADVKVAGPRGVVRVGLSDYMGERDA